MRQQKGLEHGERNVDRLEKKVADSKNRARKVQARRTDWAELNGEVQAKDVKATKQSKQDEKNADGGTGRAMEGVDIPSLDPPLPIGTTDEEQEVVSGAAVAVKPD